MRQGESQGNDKKHFRGILNENLVRRPTEDQLEDQGRISFQRLLSMRKGETQGNDKKYFRESLNENSESTYQG